MNEPLSLDVSDSNEGRRALLTDVEELTQRLSRFAAERSLDQDDLIQWVVPAPVIEPCTLAEHNEEAVAWSEAPGRYRVGLGSTRVFEGKGPRRFSDVREAASRVLSRVHPLIVEEALPQVTRVFGGFAFSPGPQFSPGQQFSPEQQGDAWSVFGQARFVLPRMAYQLDGARASFALWLFRRELHEREGREQVEQALQLLRKLSRLHPKSARQMPPLTERVTSPERWREIVTEILSAIDRNEVQKVVAARESELEFSSPLELAATLRALREGNPSATCFCFRVGDTAFVGATPERLIGKRGLRVESEALAGTFRKAGPEFAAELLRSPKEHSEHAPVVEAIVKALEPLCSALDYPRSPELRELPDLLHLCTPIHGRLLSPVHVLDLVERLHPTPAVGGVPTDRALGWIAERERLNRGWYGGPVGWFDAEGDGEFCVALRSGLLQNRYARLFAGGGIVRGSEPEHEYKETELKLQALYAALRVEF